MALAFPDIQHIITSPPGQLVAGSVLAGIVWKFFEKVEGVLSEQTKLEIAVWLRGVNVVEKVKPWPETFANVFDRVFGKEHLSWTCFWRSSVASTLSLFLVCLVMIMHIPTDFKTVWQRFVYYPTLWIFCIVISNLGPDYISLLESRFVLTIMKRVAHTKVANGFRLSVRLFLLIGDLIFTYALARLAMTLAIITTHSVYMSHLNRVFGVVPSLMSSYVALEQVFFTESLYERIGRWLWVYPAFFTSIWLWLYAASGFILKAARRFDIGFQWFNSKVDIEKKPLSAIGLVAGSLVAVVYWAFAVVAHIIR